MPDGDMEKRKVKKLYFIVPILAILISCSVYYYYSLQPKIYKSSGKFAVFYSQKSLTGDLLTSVDVTKSVSETIKTRSFLDKIAESSGVVFSQKNLDSGIGNIVKADLVPNSNIITVEFNSSNKIDLYNINNIFLSTLSATKIISDKESPITIKTIDPLYTFDEPTYPEPLKYAIATFAAVLFLGILAIYTLTP